MSFEGNWNLKLQSPMGERPATLTVTQEGATLGGSISSDAGNSEISGTSDGDAIEFSSSMEGPMGAITLEFKGTVSGDEATGSVQFGQFGGGSWSGARA